MMGFALYSGWNMTLKYAHLSYLGYSRPQLLGITRYSTSANYVEHELNRKLNGKLYLQSSHSYPVYSTIFMAEVG